MHSITHQFLVKTVKFILFWLGFGLLFFVIGKYIRLFLPLILGLIVFAVMNPIIKGLEKYTPLNRKWSVIAALVLVIVILGSLLTWFTLLLLKQAQELVLNWPAYIETIKQAFAQIWPKIHNFYLGLDPKVIEKVNDSLDTVGSNIGAVISKSLLQISSWVFFMPQLAIIVVIGLVAAFFLANDWQKHKAAIVNIFPREWRPGLKEIGNDFSVALVGFVRSELIMLLISIVMSIVGLYVLGARYAFILGLIIGLLGILPVLGAALVFVPWSILEFITGNFKFGAGLLILVAIMTVTRHVVEPKILGDNVGLDPLFVLMSMYIGLESIGPIGLIVGPFVIIAYKSLQKAGVFRNL